MTTTALPAQPLAHRQILVVYSGLVLAVMLAALDSTIVATALPTIVGEIGGLDRLAWVVTAYLLAQTIVTPLYGKLGDLYGRKVVLQTAIVLFLIGSALCGMSASMMQLIVFRAIQGLGGGGLMVTSQAVIGDIVPPRDRGRYQGIFGAVFGVASVAGPLIGGYFTTHLTWRWIFYVNIPLGVVALVVIGAVLPRRPDRVAHRIDYAGSALLAAALSAIVLLTDLGGVTYPWSSPVVIGLGVIAILALVGFVAAERRAAEPVMPLRLFGNRTFTLTACIGLIVGFALFGSVTYIPLFLQVVNDRSPTGSGLMMLPQMGGMLVTSILSGQLISRWGRYRVFPIVGTTIMAVGLFLLSQMDASTTVTRAALNMLVLGLGLGLVMQVLVIAVQNAVDYRDLGVATSGAMLFRLIGGSLGTAAFGALFTSRLAARLRETMPDAAALPGGSISPQAIAQLPAAMRETYQQAFAASLGAVFLTAAVIAVIGFVLTWLVPERPLRESIAAVAENLGRETEELFPMPTDTSSMLRLERSLSLIATRDTRRQYVRRVVERAGVAIQPLAAWVLVRLAEDPSCNTRSLARAAALDVARITEAVDRLRADGLMHEWTPTERGRAMLATLGEARRAHLLEVVSEWGPAKRHEMEEAVARVSGEHRTIESRRAVG